VKTNDLLNYKWSICD